VTAVRVAVVDHGAGNLVSIGQALVAVGADVRLAATPNELEGADMLVLPGVGAAAPAMARLTERELVGPVRRWIADDRPFLGICLGLQLLFDGSDEDGATTLRIVPGRTTRPRRSPTSAGTRSSGGGSTRSSTASPTVPISTSSTPSPVGLPRPLPTGSSLRPPTAAPS